MKKVSIQEIVDKFGKDARCRVHYQNEKTPVETQLSKIGRGQKIVKITVLFDEPKYYMINGDACYRDGVRYLIKKNNICI